jgi:hypothetical protein
LGLGARACTLKIDLASGEVAAMSGDVYSMSVNAISVCLNRGLLVADGNAAAPDSAPAASAVVSKSLFGRKPSKTNVSAEDIRSFTTSLPPFHFTPVLPSKFSLLSSPKDLSWLYTNSRVRFRVEHPEAYVLLHDFPIYDAKTIRLNPESVANKGCDVRRAAKGSETTSVKIIILDENSHKVAFQHRNLMLTWLLPPSSDSPSVFWAESNPLSPQNNNAFHFEFVRESGSTKVKIQIVDTKRGTMYTLTVRSNPDKSSSASFVSSKDNPGTALSVAGSEAFADFDLTSVLIPGSVVSLKVVVELPGHKGANVLLTHRRGDVFCDDRLVCGCVCDIVYSTMQCFSPPSRCPCRFSDSTSRWSIEATPMKHPTNTNNGAVALRNEFSGMYLSAQSKTHGENGESLEAPICSVNVVLEPYDENGSMRSSCAFTFENNCLRNCDGIFLGIEEMSQEGAVPRHLLHCNACF